MTDNTEAVEVAESGAPIENTDSTPQSLDASLDRAMEAAKQIEEEARAKADAKAEKAAERAKEKAEKAKQAEKEDKEKEQREGIESSIDKAMKAAEGKDGKEKERPAHHEPLPGMDEASAKEWEQTPDSVKGFAHRRIRELTQGLQQYRQDAESYGEFRDIADLAHQHGKKLPEVIRQYVGLESALIGNSWEHKLDAIQHVFEHAGVNFDQLARAWTVMSPEEKAKIRDARMQRHMAQIQGQVTLQHKAIQQETQAAQVQIAVSQFAAQHDDFADHENEIMLEIQSGAATSLEDAYQRAKRRKKATKEKAEAGGKSISGAPASGQSKGSDKKGKSRSVGESVDRAFAKAGL